MKLDILNINGKNTGDIEISDKLFDRKINRTLVHQYVVSTLSNIRKGTRAQKNRSEIVASGRKPWRQKGTGRARAGTIRSPLWRGGGVTFASRPRDFSKKINKKMYRAAIKSIFSELVRQNRLVAIEKPVLEKPKTKEIASFLKEFSLSKVLIITEELDINLYLSARNIPNVEVITVREINPINLLKPQKVAATSEALKQIEDWING